MGAPMKVAIGGVAAALRCWVLGVFGTTVVVGNTSGMMLASALVVRLCDKITKLVPLQVAHVVSELIFLGLGLLAQLA